jgi:hypothetical protein
MIGVVVENESDIRAINATIEAVRVDARKPEECKHWTPESQNGFVACFVFERGIPRKCCPCGMWAKKEMSDG